MHNHARTHAMQDAFVGRRQLSSVMALLQQKTKWQEEVKESDDDFDEEDECEDEDETLQRPQGLALPSDLQESKPKTTVKAQPGI